MRDHNRRAIFTATQKVATVHEHLLKKNGISDLCERHGMREPLR